MKYPKTNLHFNPSLFSIWTGKENRKDVIFIQFDNEKSLFLHLNSYCSARWSTTEKAWYLPNTRANRNFCQLHPEIAGKRILNKISPINRKEYLKFQTILNQNGYSPNTIRTYSAEFAHLLYELKEIPVQNLKPQNLQSYFLHCTENLKLSEKQIHSRINAVKYYFEKVVKSGNIKWKIPHPQKKIYAEKSLNQLEIKKVIEITSNYKHKMILILCYELGLRISEMADLKIEDVDTKRKFISIHKNLGIKSRKIPLNPSAMDCFPLYISKFNPKHYVFEGMKGSKFHMRSFQMLIKNAMQKAGIQKSIAMHGKQNSYSDQLKERGISGNFFGDN